MSIIFRSKAVTVTCRLTWRSPLCRKRQRYPWVRPLSPRGLWVHPLSPRGLWVHPLSPRGLWVHPLSPRGLWVHPLSPRGLWGCPFSPRGLWIYRLSPRGVGQKCRGRCPGAPASDNRQLPLMYCTIMSYLPLMMKLWRLVLVLMKFYSISRKISAYRVTFGYLRCNFVCRSPIPPVFSLLFGSFRVYDDEGDSNWDSVGILHGFGFVPGFFARFDNGLLGGGAVAGGNFDWRHLPR